MSTPEKEQQVQQWLAAADAAVKAEDWERAAALYRQAQEFDRYLQGVEAKLQWALRMRDTEKQYREGRAKFAAGEYDAALTHLRKARLMYASHYKDVDDLIVQAQAALQKAKWQARHAARQTAQPERQPRDQRVLLGAIAVAIALALAAGAWFLFVRAADTGGSDKASQIPAPQRNDMYKSAPAMTIDANKSYRATIQTAKGNIVVDLFPKDAPQHVNNFVFLARAGFYDNLTFHRVEPGFVIQGGDPLGNGTGGPGYNVPPEIKRAHPKGALAMARRGGPPETTPSSGSQFYITLAATPFLDGQYTAFGQATPESMAVVEQIRVGDAIKTIAIEEK